MKTAGASRPPFFLCLYFKAIAAGFAPILFMPLFRLMSSRTRPDAAESLHVRVAAIVSLAPVLVMRETTFAFQHIAIGQRQPGGCAGQESSTFHFVSRFARALCKNNGYRVETGIAGRTFRTTFIGSFSRRRFLASQNVQHREKKQNRQDTEDYVHEWFHPVIYAGSHCSL